MPFWAGMVGVTGIEPVTPSMSTKCSPAELYAPKDQEVPLKYSLRVVSIEGKAKVFKSLVKGLLIFSILWLDCSNG